MDGPTPILSEAITVTTPETAARLPLGGFLRSGVITNVSTGGQTVYVAFNRGGPFVPLSAGDATGAGGDRIEIDHEDTSEKGGKKLRFDHIHLYSSASGGLVLVVPSDLGE